MPRPDQWSPVRHDTPPPPDAVQEQLRYIPGTNVLRATTSGPDWFIDKRLSKEYVVPDEDGQDHIVRLFTVGAVASALGKKSVTIRRWIRLGLIPDSGLRTQGIEGTLGDAGRRLWTEEQIKSMVRIATEEGVTAHRATTAELNRFASRIRVLWQQNNW